MLVGPGPCRGGPVVRWRPRRARVRARLAPPQVVATTIPPTTPGELQELARLVAARGPALLVGHDPAAVGLLAVPPRSPACPERLQASDVFVVPREMLERLARNTSIQRRPPPGSFWALLFGEHQCAGVHIGPAREGA